jgi:hypothetical protein
VLCAGIVNPRPLEDKAAFAGVVNPRPGSPLAATAEEGDKTALAYQVGPCVVIVIIIILSSSSSPAV